MPLVVVNKLNLKDEITDPIYLAIVGQIMYNVSA